MGIPVKLRTYFDRLLEVSVTTEHDDFILFKFDDFRRVVPSGEDRAYVLHAFGDNGWHGSCLHVVDGKYPISMKLNKVGMIAKGRHIRHSLGGQFLREAEESRRVLNNMYPMKVNFK